MAGPPYDDDPTVLNEMALWRLIVRLWVVADENRGVRRVSSAAFDDSPDGSPTSILLADVVASTGRSAQDVLSRFPGYCLASLTAGQGRGCGQGVPRDPLPQEPAHAFLFGAKPRSARRCLAHAATWIIPPSPQGATGGRPYSYIASRALESGNLGRGAA